MVHSHAGAGGRVPRGRFGVEAYTLKEDPQILPEYCVSFFNLPEWVSIGKYHFTARFNPGPRDGNGNPPPPAN